MLNVAFIIGIVAIFLYMINVPLKSKKGDEKNDKKKTNF